MPSRRGFWQICYFKFKKGGEEMGTVLIIFFVFLVFMVIVFVLVVKRRVSGIKNSEWTGEVLDKSEEEKYDDNDKFEGYAYSVKVKTDDGRVRYAEVNYELYNKVKPGDKLKKEKGALLPKII